MSDQLKPCPFCKGMPPRDIGGNVMVGSGSFGTRQVACSECGALGREDWELADAIAAWNRRVGDEA